MRSDCIFPPGKFRMRDLAAILPIMDELLLVQCTGTMYIARTLFVKGVQVKHDRLQSMVLFVTIMPPIMAYRI